MSKQLDEILDHNDNCIPEMGESFVGYGEDESTPTVAATGFRKPFRREPPQIYLDMDKGDAGIVRKVVDKFLSNTGLRPGLELPEREAIVQALQTVLQNANKDDDLWEWLEESTQFNAADLLFAPNGLETSSHRGSLESSSMGVLSFSDLSSFSLGSHDMIKEPEDIEPTNELANNHHNINNNTTSDPAELLCEIEELLHQNRKLSEENGRLQKQVSQTEDSNSQLFREKEILEKTRISLQTQADKKRELEREGIVLKGALTSLEELNARLQEQITTQERDKALLEARIEELHDELCGNQSQIDLWRHRVEELGETLLESKVSYGNLKAEHEACCQNLKLKSSQLEEKKHLMQELITSTEILKQQKNDLEVQLCKAEQEIACLQHAARRVKSLSADLSTTEVDLNTSCEASHILESSSSSSSCSPSTCMGHQLARLAVQPVIEPTLPPPFQNESPFPLASTPQKKLLVRKLSLCAEMRSVVRQNSGELPSPFCGKHILPQALYEDMQSSASRKKGAVLTSPLRQSADRDLNPFPTLDWQADLSQDNLYPEKVSSVLQESEPKCCQTAAVQDSTGYQIIHHVNEESRAMKILMNACIELQDINNSIKRINSDAVSVLNPYPGLPGCVISEPETINNNMVSEEKDPLNMELRLLRSHIANTQAILTYLSKNQKGATGISMQSVLQEVENTCNRNISKSGLQDAASLLHHMSSDMLQQQFSGRGTAKPFWMMKEHIRDGSSTTPSQRSTPLHRSRWLTRSCPNIPGLPQSFQLQPSTHRGTQTDYPAHHHSAQQQQYTSKGEYACSPQPRHRSSSFVAAICKGEEHGNDGVTVQMPPNREVLILKDAQQQDDVCTVHASEEEQQESYRETDFNNAYQELEHLPQGDHVIWDDRLPLRRSRSEEVEPQTQEAARKRRRSFSEHYSNYSQAIDLEGHEEEEDEDAIFEAEAMACRVEATRASAQQTFRPVVGLLGSVVNSTTVTATPTATTSASGGNPMLGLSARVTQPNPAPAALLLLAQRPEKVLSNSKLRRGPGVCGTTDLAKGRFLMPDVMENSETESAKDSANGSMESEGPPPGTGPAPDGSFVNPPPPGSDPAFPSLPDAFLKKMALDKDAEAAGTEDLTGREVECKFSTLSLAFKTDKFTLGKRLELQQRQRDTAEKNIDSEVATMREVLNNLNQLCADSQMRDLITKLQHHLDIVQQSTSRMSSRAEVFGAVQQEERMSRAYETMVAYVENLKRLYEKEHHELEETRRLLIENRLLPPASNCPEALEGGFSADDPKRGSFRGLPSSTSAANLKPGTRRRASVAVIHRPNLDTGKAPLTFSCSNTTIGEFRARVNSAVGTLVSNAGTARLERLLMSGGSANGNTSPATPLSSTASSVGSQGPFAFPPAAVALPSVLQSTVHALLSARNSAPEGSTDINRDEASNLIRSVAPSGEQEGNQDKSLQQSERTVAKGGYLGEQAHLSEEDDGNGETEGKLLLLPAGGGRLSPTPSCGSSSSRQHSSWSGESSSSSHSSGDFPKGSLLRKVLRNSLFRKGRSLLLTWLPDDNWWTQWDISSTTRALRYGLGSLLFLAALFSLIVTFLPAQDASLCFFSSASSSSTSLRSLQEILEEIFRPYVTKRAPHVPH